MNKFKPLLAAAVESTDKLKYPLYASPKLDGIRCIVINGVALSRSLKPIPNLYVQRCLGTGEYDGLDGELIVGDPTSPSCYRDTNSGVMSKEGYPNFMFHVFDRIDMPEHGFEDRFEQGLGELDLSFVTVVPHRMVASEADLLAVEDVWLTMGYEGVMLRRLDGPYKHGRSTLKEGTLLKLKRFSDSEARVIEVIEKMHNGNEARIDALGHIERSSHKANLVPMGTMGALSVEDIHTGVRFEIGTGFTDEDRAWWWARRFDATSKLPIVKYQHFAVGAKDKPRFPSFQGVRALEDL